MSWIAYSAATHGNLELILPSTNSMNASVLDSVRTFRYSLTKWNAMEERLETTALAAVGLTPNDFPVRFTNVPFGYYVANIEGVSAMNVTVLHIAFGLDFNYTGSEPSIPGTCPRPIWTIVAMRSDHFTLPVPNCQSSSSGLGGAAGGGDGSDGSSFDRVRIRFTNPENNHSITVIAPISNLSIPIPPEFIPGPVRISFRFVNSSSPDDAGTPWSPPYDVIAEPQPSKFLDPFTVL